MDFTQQLQLGMNRLSENDPVMAGLVRQYGIPTFQPHHDYYQELVESIIGQQLSVKAAATIRGRFIDLFGHFPTPDEILGRDIEQLRSVGLSRPKASYIQDLALRVRDGAIRFEDFDSMSNQQIIGELIQIKGIGEWTAHMFLMFCMGRLDVLTWGDLGVKNALTKLYNFDHVVNIVDMQKLSRSLNWHPYESLVCWYAWQSLENTPNTN